ncbi:MAG: hypothetical protein J5771_05655 [Bacteroidales bacterium]|nr:hypothetical protein [Bacteroidales bacterium]
MKRILLLAAMVLPIAFFSCKKDNHASNPYKGKECVTLDVTNIGPVTATLHGYFDPKQSAHWTGYYFIVSFDKAGCDVDSLLNGKEHIPFGAYDVLPPEGAEQVILPSNHKLKRTASLPFSDTTYFVRALIYYADTVLQKEWFIQADNIKSFSTKSLSMKVLTKDATDITPFTAVLGGQVETNAGKDADIETRFIVGPEGASLDKLISDGYRTDWKTLEPAGDLSFSDSLKYTSLDFSTTYSYVACVRVNGPEYYGEVKSFTTADFNPTVTTLAAEAGPIKAALKATVSPCFKPKYGDMQFLLGPAGSTIESLKASPEAIINASQGDDYASFSATTGLLKMSTTYCVAAYARIAGKEAYGNVVSFTTTSRTAPSDAVEMGLSVFWAPNNVGATSPEGVGGYYAWGEVETKAYYEKENYKWDEGEGTKWVLTKYLSSTTWGPVVDNKYVLDPEDDAATVVMGSPWRMPTVNEFGELLDYCDWEKKEINGQTGFQVTSRLTGNSIFLPLSGLYDGDYVRDYLAYYYSNQTNGGFSAYALRVYNDSFVNEAPSITSSFRCYGTNIRAVRE